MDIISVSAIKEHLPRFLAEKLNIAVEKQVDSTNKIVKQVGADGGEEGYLLIAESQTQGRGRLGRSFFSPDGTGVYMSLLLRPHISPENATLITTAAAVSVCVALERLGVKNPQIKWVNDIFVNSKKVCGILSEGSFSQNGNMDFAVLGVGANIYSPDNDFPQELKDIAGGIFSEKQENIRNMFIAFFLESFWDFYKNLLSRSYISEYEKRCFVIGREVEFTLDGNSKKAVAIGIDENCGLRVELSDGKQVVLSSGEVSLKV